MRTAQELIELIEYDKIAELTTLDFRINFTQKELTEFTHFCIVSKSLEAVEIKDIDFNPVIEELIGAVLPLNNSIKKLELNNIASFDSVGSALKECLQFNTGIEELIISNNPLMNKVLSYVEPDLSANSKITKLVLTANALNNDSIGMLSNIIEYNTSLNEIDLSHQPLTGNMLRGLFKMIGKNENILTLKLSDTQLTSDAFNDLFKELSDNKSLLNLDLSFNNFDGFNTLLQEACFQFLKSENGLQNLNLQNCDLSRYFASNLARTFSKNAQFTSMNLSNNNLCDSGVIIVSRYAKDLKLLTALDLRNNNTTLLASYMVKEALNGVLSYQI